MPLVVLKGKDIPFDSKGDPCFTLWDELLGTFTQDEIITMCNRYLYQAFYSRTIHKNRAKEETARLSPLKKKVRELFHKSHIKATPQEIEQALEAVKKEEEQQ